MVQAQQTSFVNPFIGTSDDHGQTDPSATIPFGMIKPGPETIPRGNGGYDYQSQQLKGFTDQNVWSRLYRRRRKPANNTFCRNSMQDFKNG